VSETTTYTYPGHENDEATIARWNEPVVSEPLADAIASAIPEMQEFLARHRERMDERERDWIRAHVPVDERWIPWRDAIWGAMYPNEPIHPVDTMVIANMHNYVNDVLTTIIPLVCAVTPA
jgi:hypothetical protein